MPHHSSSRHIVIRAASLVLLGGASLGWPASPLHAQGAPRPAPRPRTAVIDSISVIDVDARRVTPMQNIVIRDDSIVAVQPASATLPDSIDESKVEARFDKGVLRHLHSPSAIRLTH